MNTRQNKKTRGWLENRKNAQVAALIMSAVSAAPALAQITIAQAEQEANNTSNTTIDTSTITDVISQGGGFVSDGYTYTNWSFLANDGTGSLDVFGKMPTGSTYTPTVGDTIQATGTYYPFRNTPELETLTSITKEGTASSIASPTVVTIPQLLQLANTATSSNSNAIQGYLLQLNDVTFTGLENSSAGNVPESTMTQHANNEWTATDSEGNAVLMYQYASSYSVSAGLALENGGAIPTTAQDVIGLAQIYNGTAEFIPLSYSNSTNVAPPPPANKTVLTPSPLAQQPVQGSSSTAGILSVGTSGTTKTVSANVGTWINVGTASNPSYEFATIPNQTVLTSLQLASSGGNSGDQTYFAGVANGAHAFPGNNYPIPTGTIGTANIGFSASDTGVTAGTTLSGSVQITNSDNLSDSPISVTLNANSPLHVLAQRDLNAGASTLGYDVGDVLVGTNATIPNVPLSTVNTNSNGDLNSSALTNVTLLANSSSAAYTMKDPFTGNAAATISATTPGYDQVFGGPSQGGYGAYNNAGSETTPIPGDTQLGGTVNVVINAAMSGTYGDAHSATVGTVTETYNPSYTDFSGASQGVVGMGLPYENETVDIYPWFTGFQQASVTASGSVAGNNVTLTNAATNDAIITEGSSSANFGIRASAWVTSASANQDGWSVSGLTSAVAGTNGAQDTPGTIIPGSGGYSDPNDTAHSVSGISFSYNPSAALAGTYTGGTYSIGLENAEYDDQGAYDGGTIYGATHNDLAPVTLPLPNETGTGNGSGTYNFGGGTFTASGPTNLTGSFTQTGGTANFQQITGGGAVTLSGGLLKIAASAPNISTLGSLAISGAGTLDITNNEITVPDTTGSAAALVADLKAGFDGGKWDGTGIISSTAAATRGTSIGYVDNGSVTTIRYTWLGDLDLSGTITGADVTAMTNGNGTSWSQGDLNYDGVKNADDWSLFELGAEMAGSKMLPAPEPAAFTLLAIPAIAAMRRRRR